MNVMKKCSEYDTEKDLSELCFRKDTQRYRNQCRSCIKLIIDEYKTKNEDQIRLQRKEYGEKTKNLKRLYDIEYREPNREKKYENQYMKKRRDSDINFKLICNIRTRTNKTFKSQNVRKTNKTFDLLGCSLSFFQR